MSLRHVTDALPITGRDEGISADARTMIDGILSSYILKKKHVWGEGADYKNELFKNLYKARLLYQSHNYFYQFQIIDYSINFLIDLEEVDWDLPIQDRIFPIRMNKVPDHSIEYRSFAMPGRETYILSA